MIMSKMNNYAYVIGNYLGGCTDEALATCSNMREKDGEIDELLYLAELLEKVEEKSELVAFHLKEQIMKGNFVTTLDTHEPFISKK